MTLNLNSLSNVKKDVELPAYDRSKLNIGIFHFGVGGFHRAHQAVIMDDLFNKGLALDFGICGVGVLPIDSRMRDVMRAQNCLYTLVEKASNGSKRTKVVGSIIDYLFAPDDVDAVIEKIVEQAKIVSMTITEGGYNIDPVTGDFDLNTVKWDIENSSKPKTVFGIVIEALRRRKQRGMQGFTIMSCDNLQENGKIAKRAFTGYDKAVDSDLAKWMEEHVSFPCSMVDRITPVTTDDDRKNVSEAVGLVDQWPVVCEDFLQWVLEDRFVAGRPPFEKSTVHVVPDVEPYELMKLRLLNAGHQGIAYFGLLMGYQFVYDVTQNELIVDYYKAYMEKEAEHTLRPISGINLREYQLKLVERFQNPYIRDTLARLAVDGSDRILKFVIPVIHDRLAASKSIWLSVSIIASFAYYLNGRDESGASIQIVDRQTETLMKLSRKLNDDPKAIAEAKDLFGDVVENPTFQSVFGEIYVKIKQEGSKATIAWLLKK